MIESPSPGARSASFSPVTSAVGTALAGATDELDVEQLRDHVTAEIREGLVVQDATGKPIWSNPAAYNLLCTNRQQLGDILLDLHGRSVDLAGNRLSAEQSPVTTTLRTGFPVRNKIIGVETDKGHLVWLSVSSRPGTRYGSPVAITSFTDVTMEVGRRHELEDALSQVGAALTPTDLPKSDRIEFAAATGAASARDFYGAHAVGPDRYGFYVGNVPADPTRAACTGSLALHTLRSAGILLDDPEAVLAHLQATVTAEWPGTSLSVVFGYAELDETSIRVRLSSSGVSRPVVVADHGTTGFQLRGPLIGATTSERRHSQSIELRSGSRLVLGSKGLARSCRDEGGAAAVFEPLSVTAPVDRMAEHARALSTDDRDDVDECDTTVLVVGAL